MIHGAHQQALLHLDVAAALLVNVAEPPALPAHGEAGVVAVAEPVRARQGGQWFDVQPADTVQRVGQRLVLHLQLALVGDVLPLAAGARAEIAAGGLDPVGRGVRHVRHTRGDVAPARRNDLGGDGLAGDAAEDEDGLAVVGLGERLAVPAEPTQLQREHRRLLTCGRIGHVGHGIRVGVGGRRGEGESGLRCALTSAAGEGERPDEVHGTPRVSC